MVFVTCELVWCAQKSERDREKERELHCIKEICSGSHVSKVVDLTCHKQEA